MMTTILDNLRHRHDLDADARVGVKAAPSDEFEIDNDEERIFHAIANTAMVDLDGEVVVPEGADTAYFATNGSLFYNHDYSLPIGSMKSFKLINWNGGKAWRVAGYISKTPFANDVFTMMDEGVIRGTSIGFLATDSRRPTEDEVEKYGPHRSIVPAWKWLELSITAFPCNASALVQSVQKSVDDSVLGGLDDALRKNKISRKSARLMGLPDREGRRGRTIVVVPTA